MGKRKSGAKQQQQRRSHWSFKRLVVGAILGFLVIQVIRIELQAAGSTKTPDEWRALMKQRPYARLPTDARSPCPMLNLLANHGFLPRDGRHISKAQLYDALVLVGAPPTITYGFLTTVVYHMYHRVAPDAPFWTNFVAAPTIDLDMLAIHNLIEHDVSLTRLDSALDDTAIPQADLVRRMHQWTLLHDGQLDMQAEHDLRKIRWYESTLSNPKSHLGLLYQVTKTIHLARIFFFFFFFFSFVLVLFKYRMCLVVGYSRSGWHHACRSYRSVAFGRTVP
jgi:hypothetical protein